MPDRPSSLRDAADYGRRQHRTDETASRVRSIVVGRKAEAGGHAQGQLRQTTVSSEGSQED
eukprot:1877549-Pyramimonas_sp.AAC.1